MGVTEVLDAGGLIQLLELGVCCHLRSLGGLQHLHGAVGYDTRRRGDLCSSRLVAGGQAGISNGTRPFSLEVRAETWGCVSASET